MNSSADSQDASSISGRKRKAEKEDSITDVPSKRAKFYQTYCRQQSFALPDSIMHYIAKNPSSAKLYAKLVQTCKYFFMKNPILLISDLVYKNEWKARKNGETKNMDLDNITSKVWLSNGFKILTFNDIQQNLVSLLLSKTFKCDVTRLTLRNQIISYNELVILASKVEHVEFRSVTVKHQDGSIVPFENFFEAFPFAKSVQFFSLFTVTTITSKTFIELLKIPSFSTLNFCTLEDIPDTFDLESFYAYMKKNKFTKFLLLFSDSISDAYKSRLEEIVDEIIDADTHDYKPPIIRFPALDSTKLMKIFSL